MLTQWRNGLRMLERIELAAATILFASIILSIFAQVVSRYGFDWPLVWVEEMATYSFIWIVFLGAAIGMKRLSHIRIEALSLALPARAQLAVWLSGIILMLFVVIYLAFRLPAVMAIEVRSTTVALPIQLPRMWFYSVPLFYSCISMALTLAYFLVAGLNSLKTGIPVDDIDGNPLTHGSKEGV